MSIDTATEQLLAETKPLICKKILDNKNNVNTIFTNIGSNLSKQITQQCSSMCDTLLNTKLQFYVFI